jgi:hypothetical protein
VKASYQKKNPLHPKSTDYGYDILILGDSNFYILPYPLSFLEEKKLGGTFALPNAIFLLNTEINCVNNGSCHVSGIFLPLRVNSLPLATIYEVKIPLLKVNYSPLRVKKSRSHDMGHCQ